MFWIVACYCNNCGEDWWNKETKCRCSASQRFNYSVGTAGSAMQSGNPLVPKKTIKQDDWYYLNKPGHHWHGERVKVQDINYNNSYFAGSDFTEVKICNFTGVASIWVDPTELSEFPPKDAQIQCPLVVDPHAGHEVIENYAGGKTFKYCRKCKVEVQ